MKKMLSVFTAMTLCMSAAPLYSYAESAESTDLNSIATSLGADTDYLNVVNYAYEDYENPVFKEIFMDYLRKCSLIEASYYPWDTFTNMVDYNLNSGLNIASTGAGISILEILSNNQVIKPSDIQAGADTLSEISYNDAINRIISGYQCVQGYTEFRNYESFMRGNLSYDEQIDNLIQTAEKNMKDNKYFFISIRSKELYHSVCGIGVADGNWNWNGKTYDKCILTLDSNAKNDNDGNARGFSEDYCIYINSETKKSYIPSYQKDTDNELSFVVIDDDTLLNYKGSINPSETINTDISDIKHVTYNRGERSKLYMVSEDGSKTLFEKSTFGDWDTYPNCVKADSVHIELDHFWEQSYANFRYINTDRWIDIELQDGLVDNENYNADIDISDNNVYIKCKEDNIKKLAIQIRMNDDTYSYKPFYCWSIDVYDLNDDINVEIQDNGILLKSNNHIKANLTPTAYTLDENGQLEFSYTDNTMNTAYLTDVGSTKYKSAELETDNDVFITIENQELTYYIDKNGDNVYDDKVEKGDVNCDGFIDASDASLILKKYAANSTNSSEYYGVGEALSDYNNDGLCDASDASLILEKYAELSTIK